MITITIKVIYVCTVLGNTKWWIKKINSSKVKWFSVWKGEQSTLRVQISDSFLLKLNFIITSHSKYNADR